LRRDIRERAGEEGCRRGRDEKVIWRGDEWLGWGEMDR